MRPTELKLFLGAMIAARQPVLITGAPGIGKSDVVAQAADAAGADMILSHPAVSDPTDAKGLPWVAPDGASATFLPFGELHRAMSATTSTVWFLDDLGQATPSVQASFMQLLLARRVNGHALPDCVTFVAATNRRTDKAGVSGILEPVKSRFAAIVELDVNLDDWCQWAFGAGVPAEVIAFLRFRPDLLSQFQPSADLTNSPVPRTWAHVARFLPLGLSKTILREAVVGAVGEGAATEFLAFLALYESLPQIDEVITNPDTAPVPTAPSTLYALVTALGMRATTETFPPLARYAERLVECQHGEFAALLLRDVARKCPAALETPEFVRLCVGELGDLISG